MGRWGWDRVGEQGMDRQGLEEGCDLDGWEERMTGVIHGRGVSEKEG